jgi:hypothetical protein
MIDATKFAKPILGTDGVDHGYRFGVGTDECAAALRKMAEAVERREIIVHKVQSGAISSTDDYSVRGLYIEFVQKEKANTA